MTLILAFMTGHLHVCVHASADWSWCVCVTLELPATSHGPVQMPMGT